jgi:hypothetical protein
MCDLSRIKLNVGTFCVMPNVIYPEFRSMCDLPKNETEAFFSMFYLSPD